MADTTFVAPGLPTGWTVYTQIRNADDEIWNGSGYVAYSVGDWASYATATPETGTSGTYVCAMPASSPAGYYTSTMHRQMGASPASTDPAATFPSPLAYWDGTEFTSATPTPTPTPTPSGDDLASAEFVTQVLSAGGVTLSESQSAILSTLITSASREISRYCSRQFALKTYRDIVTPEGTRQDRGEPATAKLSAFPVQSVTQVLTGRAGVLTIRNTSAANQFATVQFMFTGDAEYHDLAYTGLSLSRTASGVTSAAALLFSACPTLNDLAAAIIDLGNGWSATVQRDYGLFPSASLVGVREPKDAKCNGAVLDLFTQPATSYDIDRASGIMRCYGGGWSGSSLGGFGGYGAAWDGLGGYSESWGWGQYQIVYTAGWSTIPENLQMVCAEVVKGVYARLEADPSLKSETADKYSWTAKDVLTSLPDWAKSVLMYYKSYSV